MLKSEHKTVAKKIFLIISNVDNEHYLVDVDRHFYNLLFPVCIFTFNWVYSVQTEDEYNTLTTSRNDKQRMV